MRGSTALLVTGAVTIVVATTAPVLAADDPVDVAPASEGVVPAEGAAEEPASVAADQTASNPRPAPESVEAEEVAAAAERGEPRRREKEAERGDEESKQPLASDAVTIKNFKYQPDPVRVGVGDNVTWTNRDSAQHTATDEGEFDTGLLAKGESGTVTIDQAGTYSYICTVHPEMKGKLVAGSGGGSGGGTTNSSGTGGTSSDTGGSNSTAGSGSGSSASGGSSGSLPNTGQEQLPLLILGAALIAAGLLTRAFHEYWIWR